MYLFLGLALTLNIEQYLYVGGLTQGAGVRVVLHKQGAMPFPFEEGFSVNPGMSTSVGIMKVRQNLSQNHGHNGRPKTIVRYQKCSKSFAHYPNDTVRLDVLIELRLFVRNIETLDL